MKSNYSNIKGIIILLTAAFVWGVAFTAQSAGSEHLSAFSYTAIRYAVGVVPLIPIAYLLEIRYKDIVKIKRSIMAGMLCGAVMFVAITLQQYGIQLGSDSGKAGFITCLYILIVPIFGLALKRYPALNVWLGVVLAVIGMYFLTVKESSKIEFADLLVMFSAVFWAFHILVVDKFASNIHAVTFSAVQFITVSLISSSFMLVFDSVSVEAVKSAWLPILYGGLVSVAVGYTLQTIGQKYAKPVSASLALSMESVFAALAGAVLLKENLGIKGYVGCGMIFAAIIFAQLPESWFKPGVNKAAIKNKTKYRN